jgi:hypothetical protein
MSPYDIQDKALQVPLMVHRLGTPTRIVVGLIALLVWLVQVSHPWIHPFEVIDPSADLHVTCAVSHVAVDLPVVLPPFTLTTSMFTPVVDPLLWLGCPCFIHHQAPRPPPFLSS